MGLRDIESTLPPGFRFYPSDEELVCHYLYKKVFNEGASGGTMVEVDLHTSEPWELPEVAKLSASEWYFFSFRDRKYSTGSRTNRATKSGYWKATGKDRAIYDASRRTIVGMRKTLVFYGGRAPNGIKSNWVMHEFRLENPYATPANEDWVLCRVSEKRKGDDDVTMTTCPSPTDGVGSSFMISSGPPLLQDDQNYNCTTSFLDVNNFLQCNYFDHLPLDQEMNSTHFAGMVSRDHKDEFGVYLDMEGPAGFGNIGDFRIQGHKDGLYYQ